jgi:hypothetical protein
MKLSIAYIVACLTGCVSMCVIQFVLVLSGMSGKETLNATDFAQNSSGVIAIFLVAFFLEIVAPKFGMKRWQALALICIFCGLIVFLMNASGFGRGVPITYILSGIVMLCAGLSFIFYTSSWIGEKVYQALEGRANL